MNIWIFNHHAQGPNIPGGTRHYDLAKQLISYGHNVTIFAAGFHYTLLKETIEYNQDGYKVEDKDGAQFVWVKTYPYQRNNLKRMFNILSYAWKLNFLIPKLSLKKPDIIIGTTVHPFAPLVAYKFSKKYKVPFIFEIRDLWPQSFIDIGIWKKNSLVSKIFKQIEKYTVNKANNIISLSPKTEQYLKDEYEYEYGSITYIPNSVDVATVNKNKDLIDTNNSFLELEHLKKQGKELYMFTGAIVVSNNIGIFIKVAKKLNIKNIQIVLVGKGQERAKYEKIVQTEKIVNLSFIDPVNKNLVPKLLNYANVLLLIQGNVQWGSSNKLYDYLAAKKPIITSLYVSHNDIVEDIKCGYSTKYNNSEEMVEKIEQLHKLPKNKKNVMKENAYKYVSENHDIKIMAKKLESLCLDMIND